MHEEPPNPPPSEASEPEIKPPGLWERIRRKSLLSVLLCFGAGVGIFLVGQHFGQGPGPSGPQEASSAEARYQDLQRILLDPASPLESQIQALRQAPEVAAMRSPGQLAASAATYPNAPRIRALLLAYMKLDRAEPLMAKAQLRYPSKAQEPLEQETMLRALEPLAAVSEELLFALHRMGPPASPGDTPKVSLWNLAKTAQASGENSWPVMPREHPQTANQARKEGDPPIIIDLQHIAPRDFVGLQLSQVSVGDNFRLRLPEKASLRMARIESAALKEAQLPGADLSYAQLQGSDLSAAQLSGASLSYAQMQGAIVNNAQLKDADFSRAQLQGVNLDSAELPGANFSFAQMQGSVLRHARLEQADFSYAQLPNADLRFAKMTEAAFPFAQLPRADLRNSEMSRVILREANMQRAILAEANMQAADLRGAHMQGAKLSGVDLGDANLRGAQMLGAVLEGTNLDRANLAQARMDGAILNKAGLSFANLRQVNMKGAELDEVSLSCADLTEAQMQGADSSKTYCDPYMVGAHLSRVDMRGVRFRPFFGGAYQRFKIVQRNGSEVALPSWDEGAVRLLVPGALIEAPIFGSWEFLELRFEGNEITGELLLAKARERLKSGEKLTEGMENLLTELEPLDHEGLKRYPFPVEYEADLKALLGEDIVHRVSKQTQIAGATFAANEGSDVVSPAYMDSGTKELFRAQLTTEHEAARAALKNAKTEEERSKAEGMVWAASESLAQLKGVITDPSKIEERRKWNLLEAVKQAQTAQAMAR